MEQRVFTGFGFGAIQAGLFAYEAHRSGRFNRIVVAEVLPEVVHAVRSAEGSFGLNVAGPEGIDRLRIPGLEILNPREQADRDALVHAVAESCELATALPSVAFYGGDRAADAAAVIAAGVNRKLERPELPDAVIYTAENNNHAAELLERALAPLAPGFGDRCQCLNTVIGKMSGVVTDPGQITEQSLVPAVEGIDRAFLVEAFNRILIGRIRLPGFTRGIGVFEEKDDLLPFEEAKLFGHNATHALIGYLLRRRGRRYMAEARDHGDLLSFAREAFLEESGAALCRKHDGVDPLFTPAGYAAYADDLLERMLRPSLRDTVERITRDPKRKLGWGDRLVGTMRLCLSQNVTPARYAAAASAALDAVRAEDAALGGLDGRELLRRLWGQEAPDRDEAETVADLVLSAHPF